MHARAHRRLTSCPDRVLEFADAAVHCGAEGRRRKLAFGDFAGHGMADTLEDALQRLDGAVGQLEFAIARRLEGERRRGDLDTELQIMQDDRARLAVELDGALARLARMEAATQDVGRRVKRAAAVVREVVARADQPGVRS